MNQNFDPGPVSQPFATLAREFPGPETYPPGDFRLEWGPVFHRGRLDGSARILLIGQDPGQHEAIVRRILVGEAGQRVQSLLGKLGYTRSYVMVNAFLYSVYGQGAAERHRDDAAIAAYRHRWLDAFLVDSQVEAVIALGSLANAAFASWRRTTAGQRRVDLAYAHVMHPTAPEGAAGGDQTRLRQLMRQMLANWNRALRSLHPAVRQPDVRQPLVPYQESRWAETKAIPEEDLPAGMPPWMRSLEKWAERRGRNAEEKRATIVVSVPPDERLWRE